MLRWIPWLFLAYMLCSLITQWNMYLPPSSSALSLLGLRQLHWKMNRHSTGLSVALSVVRVAQPDQLGRRSSTFTLATSKAVLVNEVAISYCSMKHLKHEHRRRRRCADGGIKLLWRKDELKKEKCWFAMVPLIVQVLFLWGFSWIRGKKNGGAEDRVTVLGGCCWGCCFAFFTRIWNSVLLPKQWQIISNAHQPSRLPWDVPISLLFVIYFPFLHLNVSQHIKPILCLYCCMITVLFMAFMNHIWITLLKAPDGHQYLWWDINWFHLLHQSQFQYTLISPIHIKHYKWV